MSHIFISYSRKDLDFAQKIVDALSANKLDTWTDWKSIPKGEDWEQEIYRGIEDADAFLFLISPDSVKSEMCNKEIVHAVNNGKRILPIVVHDTDPKSIHPEISKRNWIFCRDRQDDFSRAIEETRKTIHTDYEWLKYHTKLQVKALDWERHQDNSRLLRGKELQDAEQKLAGVGSSEDPQPTDSQRGYVVVSREVENEDQRKTVEEKQKTNKRLRNLGIIISASAIVAIIATTLATLFGGQLGISSIKAQNANATAQAESTARAFAESIALSKQLAAQAQTQDIEDGNGLILSGLLALESTRLYLSQESDQALRNFLKLTSLPEIRMECGENFSGPVSYSNDYDLMACTLKDTTVRVFKISTGKMLSEIKSTETINQINHLVFGHGKNFLMSVEGYQIKFWDVSSGKEILTIEPEHEIISASLSPNDSKVIIGDDRGLFSVWDVETGEMLFEKQVCFGVCWITASALNSNGEIIAAGNSDGDVFVWDIPSGRELFNLHLSCDGNCWNAVTKLVFSSDDKWLAVAGTNGTARTLNLHTGSQSSIVTHQEAVGDIVFSPDNREVASVSGVDGSIYVWEASNGKIISTRLHDQGIYSIQFSPDGSSIVFGGEDGIVTVWNVKSSKDLGRIIQNSRILAVSFYGTNGDIISTDDTGLTLVWNPDLPGYTEMNKSTGALLTAFGYANANLSNNFIATGDSNGNSIVWDVRSGNQLGHVHHNTAVTHIAFSSDGRQVVSSSTDGAVTVWEAATGLMISQRFYENSVNAVAFNSHDSVIASGTADGVLALWSVNDGSEIIRFTGLGADGARDFGQITHVTFSPDDELILADVEGIIYVYDLNTFEEKYVEQKSRLGERNLSINNLMALDNTIIYTGETGIHIWDVVNGQEMVLEPGVNVYDIAISPDSKDMAAANEDGTIRIFNVETGQEKYTFVSGGSVLSVAYSHDGKYIISGGRDNTSQIWDILMGRVVASVKQNDFAAVTNVGFSFDDNWALSVSANGDIKVWPWQIVNLTNIACQSLPRNFTMSEWEKYIGDGIPYQVVCPTLPIP